MVNSGPFRAQRPIGRVKIVFVLLAASLTVAIAQWGAVWWKVRGARTALQRGDLAEALTLLQAAERWPPRLAESAFLLGRVFRRRGELEQCEKWLQTAARRGWPAEDLQNQYQLLHLQCGRFDEAQPWLTRVLSSGADDELAEEVYEAQAKGFLHSYRLNDAVVCLRFWIQWKPRAVQPRLWLADVWQRCDRSQAAADEFRAILELDPEHFEARRRLAENLLNLNDVAKAFAHFQICAEKAPDDEDVTLGMARCLRRLGRLDEAEATLSKRVQNSQSKTCSVDMLVELGQIALELRQTDRALELLQEATKIDPVHALAHSTLASAYLKAGQTERAEEHRALADQINERFDRLTEIINQLTEAPGDADLRFQAGQVLMEQGLRAEGAAWMETALVVDPSHSPTHEALEEYFTSIGEMERASYHRQLRKGTKSTSQIGKRSASGP